MGIVSVKVLNPSLQTNILTNLYAGDTGKDLPNDLSWLSIRKFDGTPYLWVQKLCGLSSTPTSSSSDEERPTIRSLIERIQARYHIRLERLRQYAHLQKKSYIFGLISDEFPSKPKSTFRSWNRMDKNN